MGARAMASSRGFLNIQSLNELTYENVWRYMAVLWMWFFNIHLHSKLSEKS